jgi:HK97 gp10 family phage protein
MKPEEFASRMAEAASAFRPATELLRAVGRVVRVSIQGQVRRRAYRTGRLHDSIQERVLGDNLMVEATAPYARFVNDGTRYMEGRRFMEHGMDAALPDAERELRVWGEGVLGKVGGR